MTSNSPAGLMFIDFAHAYDYISQEYILETLPVLGFPPVLCKAIKILMTSQKGRVIVNGDLTDIFEVANGGKQGDPLFPLIFIAALEGLYALLETSPDYRGILTPDAHTHFKSAGYADDTTIAIGSDSDIEALEHILPTFEQASGQEIKAAKSFIMWLGVWKSDTTTN